MCFNVVLQSPCAGGQTCPSHIKDDSVDWRSAFAQDCSTCTFKFISPFPTGSCQSTAVGWVTLGVKGNPNACLKSSTVTLGNQLVSPKLKNGDSVYVYIKDGSYKKTVQSTAWSNTLAADLTKRCRDDSNNGLCGRWESPVFSCVNCM